MHLYAMLFSWICQGVMRAVHAPPHRHERPCKPLPPVIWFNDRKIVDRVDITPQG